MKKGFGGVLINEAVLSNMNVSAMIENEGCEGIGMLVCVCMYLKKCYHGIGMFDKRSLHGLAKKAHKQETKIKEFILKWGIFKVSEDKKFFVLEKYRKIFGFTVEISARECDVLSIYGNFIKGEPKEYTLKHPVEESSEDSASEKLSDKSCTKDVQNINKTATTSGKLEVQSSDNKEDTSSLGIDEGKGVGIGIIRKGNNKHIPTTSSVSDVDSEAAEGEENDFNFLEKKLISCTEWRKSTSKTRGVNLEDDNVLHFFAEWMRDYCISNNKMPHNLDEILHYAASLLTQGLRTRKCFDEAYRRDFLHEEQVRKKKTVEERPVYAPKKPLHPGTFEQLIDGKRVGLDGQILPRHAPRQINSNDRWSYRLDKYVDVSVWDREAEEKARLVYEREQKEKERARKQAYIDKCRRIRESMQNGIRSIGDIINDSILPNMKHAQ